MHILINTEAREKKTNIKYLPKIFVKIQLLPNGY